jgi:hypothetical protein
MSELYILSATRHRRLTIANRISCARTGALAITLRLQRDLTNFQTDTELSHATDYEQGSMTWHMRCKRGAARCGSPQSSLQTSHNHRIGCSSAHIQRQKFTSNIRVKKPMTSHFTIRVGEAIIPWSGRLLHSLGCISTEGVSVNLSEVLGGLKYP